ncbi:chloride channel protein [Chitinophaga sp. YIM B06452]|uniref:chloride channel protein n=1 Tax=Chitinophaga sp. YIM B06452 TaxID=3082158 RepID=UPI0031FE5FB5
MKLPAFFAHREGLPVADHLPFPAHIHQPLKRVWMLWCYVILWAAVIGIVALLLLQGFLLLEKLATNIVPGIALLPIVLAGAFVVWQLLKKGPLAKLAAQLVYSITGMPLGVEGAVLKIAALLRPFRSLSGAEKDVMMVSALAAGIAAWFGTPLAAVALVYFVITRRRTGYVLLAAITGAALHYAWFGMPAYSPLKWPGLVATGIYTLLGLLLGIMAAVIVRTVQALNTVSGNYLTIAAAILVGVMVWLKAVLFGPGMGVARQVLLMNEVTLMLLINVGLYKLITIIIAAGARIPGGIVTPLLAAGAANGLLTALWLQSIFSDTPLDPRMAAAVGVAALLGSITRLPLMAMVFALEISFQPAAIVPVLLATLLSYAASAVFLRRL